MSVISLLKQNLKPSGTPFKPREVNYCTVLTLDGRALGSIPIIHRYMPNLRSPSCWLW